MAVNDDYLKMYIHMYSVESSAQKLTSQTSENAKLFLNYLPQNLLCKVCPIHFLWLEQQSVYQVWTGAYLQWLYGSTLLVGHPFFDSRQP